MRPCDGERGGAGIEGTPREGSVPGKPREGRNKFDEEMEARFPGERAKINLIVVRAFTISA
jgi:hypothetical protein